MAEFITYEGIAFNKEWVASKTLKAFSEHEAHHGLSAEQLKEVHEMCGGKSSKKKEEKPADKSSDSEV